MRRTDVNTAVVESAAGLTRRWCAGLLATRRAGLPPEVLAQARRSLRSAVGCAVAGSRTKAVDAILASAARLGPPGAVPLPGRTERVAAPWAVLATGTAGHAHDVHADDVHPATSVRPGAATFAALLPLAAAGELTTTAFVESFALGVEAQLRVALAMTPWHQDEGWHITSTVGVLGTAVAVGVALDLDEEGLAEAVGIAASTTLGTRESFGSMVQPFATGKAAANGWLAAQLAANGFTGSRDVLAAPRGYLAVLSPHSSAPERLVEGLGEHWVSLDGDRATGGPPGPPSGAAPDGGTTTLLEQVFPGRATRESQPLPGAAGDDALVELLAALTTEETP